MAVKGPNFSIVENCRCNHVGQNKYTTAFIYKITMIAETGLRSLRFADCTYHLIWFKEQHVECQSKCNHQQQSKKSNLQKRLDNIYEHQNVDSCHRPFLKKWYESNPAQEYRYNSNLPLPVVNAEAGSCKHKCEYHGAQVQGDLQPVDPILQVLQWVPAQLGQLYCKSQECSCNGKYSANKDKSVFISGQI